MFKIDRFYYNIKETVILKAVKIQGRIKICLTEGFMT
jgi:hypothetical protein